MSNDQTGAEWRLREELARRSGTRAQDWHLAFKARYGMKAAFDALRQELPDRARVVTQLFTCCTAVDPIVSAGLQPVYADIDPRNLSCGAQGLPLDGAACVMLQHTFGIQDVAHDEAVRNAAHAAGAIVMEDNAHCVARLARDAHGQPVADVSVHSFGIEKMLPDSRFGGAVWVNPGMEDARLRQALTDALEALPPLDPALEAAAQRYRNQIRVLAHLPHGMSRALSARMTRSGSFEPAVSDDERRARLPHPAQQIGSWVAQEALQALQGLDANEGRRRARVGQYNQAFLGQPALEVPAAVSGEQQPLLRYPVVLGSSQLADQAVQAIARLGFYAVRWYRPLLLPGALDPAAFSYDPTSDAWPQTQRISEGIVCLPTDLSDEQTASIAQVVLKLASQA